MSSRTNLWLWLGLLVGGARIALALVMMLQSDVTSSAAPWTLAPRVDPKSNDLAPDRGDSSRTSAPFRLRGLTH